MRLTRFTTPENEIVYGEDEGEGRALLLNGDPWRGFQATDKRVVIGERLAPVEPVNIFCIGLNYRAHAEETAAKLPENPVIFMKPTTALNHPDAEIVLPACCQHGPEVDYEAELAVVIGKTARNVSEEDALEYVFGYTCANDVSARRWQKHGGGGQWVKGKSFDSFCPLGPVLVTADEIPDPQTLKVESILNGKVMQDGHTSDMIFPVARLIQLLSQDTTLLPGTLILTGTPAGVGFARKPPVFLADGDRIEVRISGIGVLSNSVVQG
ncbi:MAG: fumarylacetoacetate hydrolase family protein [Gammaproteobacteria bacterium]|nr:fumarylacetoacetate hydrolase family protein [Gammaproteobacteria bacterium]MCB1903330.1 fumarylacetoacetate hydrolase family protein [Gammaproteobacteria bacterium]